MFDPIGGHWDENSMHGWWGDDPPFSGPLFVVTHHEREPLQLGDTPVSFVTEGVESAAEQARAASGGGDVCIAGGASVFQQALHAGLVDDFQLHIVPVLLGGGTRLFQEGEPPPVELEISRVVESGPVTHIRYEVKGS